MLKNWLFPNKNQWKRWKAPTKLSWFSTWLKLFGFIIAAISFIIVLYSTLSRESRKEHVEQPVINETVDSNRSQFERLDMDSLLVESLTQNHEPKNDTLSSSGNSLAFEYYEIKLFIPAYMSDAEILVDGEYASIVNYTPTIKTIRVRKKETFHQFELKNEIQKCVLRILVTERINTLTPCDK